MFFKGGLDRCKDELRDLLLLLGARVQRMQMELELPEDIVNDLLSLAGSDLVVIADDSASMNLVAEPGSGSVLTRWDELKNTCGDAASPDILVV